MIASCSRITKGYDVDPRSDARQREGRTIVDGLRRLVPLVVWLSALATGLVVFHALGQDGMAPPPLTEPDTWGDWLDAREPAVAAAALLRLVVLALAWYLVGATTVGIVARLVRVAGLIRVADALTLPMVRRLLQGALGISLATAMVGASTAPVPRDLDAPRLVLAAEQTSTEQASTEHGDGGQGPEHTLSMRVVDPEVADAGDEPASGPISMRLVEQELEAGPDAEVEPPVTDQDEPAAADDAVHRVEAGESLWSIARDALADRWDRAPSEAEVHDYWQELVEHNRAGLADPDNPDLIFPGDEIGLPGIADDHARR
jgi:hypothetical protein